MTGEKDEESAKPLQPDLAAVLAALEASREEAKAAQEAARLREEALSKRFESLLTDSHTKHALLEKEIATLRDNATDNKSDADDELVYVSHSPEDNPFPRRPRNCGLKPDHYNLYGDQTADLLNAKTHSSLKFEYRTLAPTLSYFFDAKFLYEHIRDHELSDLSDDLTESLEAVFNTLDGCYNLLNQRHAVIKIRARAESETGGVSDENQLLLNYLETKLHGVFPGKALVDSEMEGWLKEFRDRTAAAELKQAANKSAARKRDAKGTRASETEGKAKPDPKKPKKPPGKGWEKRETADPKKV